MLGNEKRNKALIYTLLEAVAVFVICIVSGALDWTHLSFTWDKVTTPNYWIGVLQKFVMLTCALLVGYFARMEKLELKDPEYYSLLDTYRELLKSKYESFIEYIETIYNPETKKRFIKLKYDNKLLWLDKTSKSKWKLEYNKAIKSGDFDNFNWSSKYSKAYALRRKRLTEMADPKYIDENYETISIKYPIVSPHNFTYNLRNNSINNAEYRVSNKSGKDFVRIIGKKLIMTVLISVTIAMFAIDPSVNELLQQTNGWVALIIKYIFRVFMIIFNFFWGAFSGKEMFANNFILPLNNRIRILKQYIDWCKKENKELTYADQLMNSYRDRAAQEVRLTNLIDIAQSTQKNITDKFNKN